jgi:hypothetical protein
VLTASVIRAMSEGNRYGSDYAWLAELAQDPGLYIEYIVYWVLRVTTKRKPALSESDQRVVPGRVPDFWY